MACLLRPNPLFETRAIALCRWLFHSPNAPLRAPQAISSPHYTHSFIHDNLRHHSYTTKIPSRQPSRSLIRGNLRALCILMPSGHPGMKLIRGYLRVTSGWHSSKTVGTQHWYMIHDFRTPLVHISEYWCLQDICVCFIHGDLRALLVHHVYMLLSLGHPDRCRL